ncbi:hypothetical protein, partial [Winogradskyella sp.]|uniref:hypothetical protein n=1 Tax=Winogradskyella sp. TaxID=1883156 RepID=UPI003703FFB3
ISASTSLRLRGVIIINGIKLILLVIKTSASENSNLLKSLHIKNVSSINVERCYWSEVWC